MRTNRGETEYSTQTSDVCGGEVEPVTICLHFPDLWFKRSPFHAHPYGKDNNVSYIRSRKGSNYVWWHEIP